MDSIAINYCDRLMMSPVDPESDSVIMGITGLLSLSQGIMEPER